MFFCVTDYTGNYVYENSSIKQISHSEGYLEPNGSGGYQYVYRYADIWGNTRITYADDNNDGSVSTSEVRREQNYYPFGLQHKGYNEASYGVKNNLKTYQGQEFTEDLGLNTHEWRYRISDPAIGRFWQIDPLAEKYTYNSTYAFAENKLGSGIELEGLEVLPWNQLAISDAAQNPNGVGAHALGVAEGLVNSAQGVVDAVMNPVQTAKGIANLAVAAASKGNVATMAQADTALGTNSLETAGALVTAVEQRANDLVSGSGIERGNVIGNIAGAAIGAKGANAAIKTITNLKRAAKAGSFATQTFDQSTSLVAGTEFSGTISAQAGAMTVEIEMIAKITKGVSSNAGLITAVEGIAAKNGMSSVTVIGNVLNPASASKAAVPYVKAGYNVTTKTVNGATELIRTKTFK